MSTQPKEIVYIYEEDGPQAVYWGDRWDLIDEEGETLCIMPAWLTPDTVREIADLAIEMRKQGHRAGLVQGHDQERERWLYPFRQAFQSLYQYLPGER